MAENEPGECTPEEDSRCKLKFVFGVEIKGDKKETLEDFSVLSTDVDKDCNCVVGSEHGGFLCNLNKPGCIERLAPIPNDVEVSSVKLASSSKVYASYGTCVSSLDLRQSSNAIFTLNENADEVNDISLTQDEVYLAAADDSGDTKIFDLRKLKVFKTLRNMHKNICSRVLFLDSTTLPAHLLTAGLDCKVFLWDFAKPKAIYSHNCQDSLASLGDSSVYMFNPPMVNAIELFDKSTIICGLGNGCVEFLNIQPTKRLQSLGILESHRSTGVTSLCSFADDHVLVTSGNDAVVNIWNLRDTLKRTNESSKKKKKNNTKQMHLKPMDNINNSSKINSISKLKEATSNSFVVGDQSNVLKVFEILQE